MKSAFEGSPLMVTTLDQPRHGHTGSADICDRELVTSVARGDREALAELYLRHGGVVFGQIMLLVGERGMSEEILQDTMLAVWQGAAAYRGESRVRTWMIAIARRQARDRTRRHWPPLVAEDVLAEWADEMPGPEPLALDRIELASVAAAVSGLRPAHREVLGLVFGAGLTLSEAADVLEIPTGTVKSRLFAARAALAEQLREKGCLR